MGKLILFVSACLFNFYVVAKQIPKDPGWWSWEIEPWRNYALVNSRTDLRESNEWFWYVDTYYIELIRASELDGWFIGWAIVFGLMLYYWPVYFYPLFSLYK